jgi:hypothetical protein
LSLLFTPSQEIENILAGKLTDEDEEAILAELDELVQQVRVVCRVSCVVCRVSCVVSLTTTWSSRRSRRVCHRCRKCLRASPPRQTHKKVRPALQHTSLLASHCWRCSYGGQGQGQGQASRGAACSRMIAAVSRPAPVVLARRHL